MLHLDFVKSFRWMFYFPFLHGLIVANTVQVYRPESLSTQYREIGKAKEKNNDPLLSKVQSVLESRLVAAGFCKPTQSTLILKSFS